MEPKKGPQDVPKSVQRPPKRHKLERPEKHEFSRTPPDTPGDTSRRGEPSPRGSIYIVDLSIYIYIYTSVAWSVVRGSGVGFWWGQPPKSRAQNPTTESTAGAPLDRIMGPNLSSIHSWHVCKNRIQNRTCVNETMWIMRGR